MTNHNKRVGCFCFSVSFYFILNPSDFFFSFRFSLLDLHSREFFDNTITTEVYSSVRFPTSAVKSFPKAQFIWQIRGINSTTYEKIVDGEKGRLLISQSGDLYIVGVRREDTGAYRCVVTNPVTKQQIVFNILLNVNEGALFERPLDAAL